jgi:hypothetical protein
MNVPPPTIAPGSADTAAVVAAQRNLNVADAREQSAGRSGLSACPLTEDGLFGSATEQAIIDFQTRRGLTVDGIIGPATWGQILQGVNPDSGVSASALLPIEGTVRWSVSIGDIAARTEDGAAPSPAQLSGVSVTVGGNAAANPEVSADGRLIYFTPAAGSEGSADLVITGGDGSSFVLPQAIPYTAFFPAALEGLGVAVALGIQEAALVAKALEVGQMRAFVDGVAASLRDYQHLIVRLLGRLKDPAGVASANDGAAWMGHLATRARMVTCILNEQFRITLAKDPEDPDTIAELDGLPFGGADDQPTLDTGATVLLMTEIENVVVPGSVNLTA